MIYTLRQPRAGDCNQYIWRHSLDA